jgi:hypothetical protein
MYFFVARTLLNNNDLFIIRCDFPYTTTSEFVLINTIGRHLLIAELINEDQ